MSAGSLAWLGHEYYVEACQACSPGSNPGQRI